MTAPTIESVEQYARAIYDILRRDNHLIIVVDGVQGIGKSTLTCQIGKSLARLSGAPFRFEDNITYSMVQLKESITGAKQLPEYSILICDELINVFYKRDWYDAKQKDAVKLLNKCRDRHLVIMGSIPNFWDLDKGLLNIVSLWVHVHRRGKAWVFQKTENPASVDKWERTNLYKHYEQFKNPYGFNLFISEIRYNDFTPEEKIEYERVRNVKRHKDEERDRQAEQTERLLKRYGL